MARRAASDLDLSVEARTLLFEQRTRVANPELIDKLLEIRSDLSRAIGGGRA